MTTVVTVRTPQHIVIGADTLLTQGETLLPHTYNHTQKIYTVGESCIGLSGSVSHYTSLIQALRQLGDQCGLWGEEQVFETFTKVHKKLKDEFFLNPKKQPDDPYESNHISAMVANGSGIYGVYAHREVLTLDRFWCNGSGRAYALGAMHALWAERTRHHSEHAPDALDIARAGLAAGMEFDRASGGEMRLFRFVTGERGGPEVIAATTP
jgi:ATP-dependent HslUV protease, peptidase subunit HslV